MQEQILSLVEALDETRKDILSSLEGLTEDQLAFRPDKKSWSPLDIAEHCALTERSLLCNMPEPGTCIHAAPTLTNRLNRLRTRYVLRWRIPVQISAQGLHPQGGLRLEDIAAMWGDDMAWLRKYLENTPAESLEHAYFRHPIAGPLTLAQVLDMAVLHIDYHLPMLAARIKSARKTTR